jgi:hypothetical protein
MRTAVLFCVNSKRHDGLTEWFCFKTSHRDYRSEVVGSAEAHSDVRALRGIAILVCRAAALLARITAQRSRRRPPRFVVAAKKIKWLRSSQARQMQRERTAFAGRAHDAQVSVHRFGAALGHSEAQSSAHIHRHRRSDAR